jgi:hypothetical protein
VALLKNLLFLKVHLRQSQFAVGEPTSRHRYHHGELVCIKDRERQAVRERAEASRIGRTGIPAIPRWRPRHSVWIHQARRQAPTLLTCPSSQSPCTACSQTNPWALRVDRSMLTRRHSNAVVRDFVNEFARITWTVLTKHRIRCLTPEPWRLILLSSN